MNIPMREKDVDEAVGVWLEVGAAHLPNMSYITITTLVLVEDSDLFQTAIPSSIAEAVCNEQEKFRKRLYSILCE